MLYFPLVITGTQVGQAIITVVVAIVGYILKRQQNQIHVLVNSRLSEALDRIAQLEAKLGLQPGQPVHDEPV